MLRESSQRLDTSVGARLFVLKRDLRATPDEPTVAVALGSLANVALLREDNE
jgi:hypothetical protein